MADRHQLELAIAAQEGLRGVVPDEVVDAVLSKPFTDNSPRTTARGPGADRKSRCCSRT